MEGYIKLWRKMMLTSFYKDSHAYHLATHLIMKANHKDNRFVFNNKEVTIKRGQMITGRNKLSEETGMTSSMIHRKLTLFKNVGFITVKSNNKFSLITICNYEPYQKQFDEDEQPANSQRTASEHKQ